MALEIGGGIERFGEYTMDGVGNSTTNTPDLVKEKHIPDPYKELNLGLGFQWEADIWGKLTDQKRAAVSRWMKSVEASRLARTLLISEVASQYYDLVGLDKQRQILVEAINKARDSYNLTNELMKEGEVSRLSVDQFRSRRLKLDEMLLDTEQQIGDAERALALLLGKLPFESVVPVSKRSAVLSSLRTPVFRHNGFRTVRTFRQRNRSCWPVNWMYRLHGKVSSRRWSSEAGPDSMPSVSINGSLRPLRWYITWRQESRRLSSSGMRYVPCGKRPRAVSVSHCWSIIRQC